MKTFRKFCESTPDDIDWLALLNSPQEVHKAEVQIQHANHEIDKKIDDLDAKIADLEAEADNWNSKRYKANSKVVAPGGIDNFNSPVMRVDQINANRRKRRLQSLDLELRNLRSERQKLVDRRQPEAVSHGDTVSFWDEHSKRQDGHVAEIVKDPYKGPMARISSNGKNYVRPLNQLMMKK